jgi:hypothetical protein
MAEGDGEPAVTSDGGEGLDSGGADGGGSGDGDGDKKKTLLDRMNPFGGSDKKADPKDTKAKKAADEQKKKDLEEARKKKEDLEKAKVERQEQEETARMAAKRERYQQLLQKNPDPTRRVFQFLMKAIKLDYLSSEPSAGLFLRVTLGGDYSEREEPGKGLVRKGKRGQQFKTAPAPKLEADGTQYFRNEFGSGMPVYWMGSYVDLETQEFHVEIMQAQTIKKARRRAQTAIALSQLAQGSVMRELSLRDDAAVGERATTPFVRVSFVAYFQARE